MKLPSGLLINLSGGVVLMALAGVAAWYGFGEPSTASATVAECRAEVAVVEEDVARIRQNLAKWLSSLEANREELESKGSLPSQTPVEKDLARITRLAQKHRITLDEIVPQVSAEYPGIRELCYSVKGDGRFTDWLAFLRGFEACSFWADITHLKITQAGQGARAMFSTSRVELTVGFFSATDVTEETATEPENG